MDNTIFSTCTTTNNDPHVTVPYRDGGGAIASYLSQLTFQGNTTFMLNSAKHGGAIFAVESLVTISTNTDHLTSSDLLIIQAGIIIVNNNNGTTGGGIHLYYCSLIVSNGQCHLTGKYSLEKGGGIYAVHSYIKLESCDMCEDNLLTIANNSAKLGGGVNLEGASRIVLSASNCSVVLIQNSADCGAAIYGDDYTKYDTCRATSRIETVSDIRCFIDMFNPYLVMPTTQVP